MPQECTELVPAQSRLTVKFTYKPIADVDIPAWILKVYRLLFIVLGVNIMIEAQCHFADEICGRQPPVE